MGILAASESLRRGSGFIRPPILARWVVLVVLLVLGAGAVSGFNNYRRYTELERRLITVKGTIDERNARIVSLTKALAGVQVQLELAGSGLRASRQALGATERRLRDAAEEASGQQRRVEVLQMCLAGTVQAMNYLAVGDQHRAMRVMVEVDRECKQAQTLLALH